MKWFAVGAASAAGAVLVFIVGAVVIGLIVILFASALAAL